MKTHQDMRTSKSFSIWIGNISDEDQLDEYMNEQFSVDFGFEIYVPAGPECDAGELKPVRDILTGFSQYSLFIDTACDLAKAKGIDKANSAIVFYQMKYDELLISNNRSNKFEFIGNIELT